MKQFLFLFLSFLWAQDYDTVVFNIEPEFDGPLEAKLIYKTQADSRKAFVYLHGYSDYFFQHHLADSVRDWGYNFYAIELRRYGSSMDTANLKNYIAHLEDYFPEIDTFFKIIAQDNDQIIWNGHSTGGLIAAYYMNFGAQRDQVNALILNSPFLDFNLEKKEASLVGMASFLGSMFKKAKAGSGLTSVYAKTISSYYQGEWEFDTLVKPIRSFPVYLGWSRAIRKGQKKLHRASYIEVPILLMHSDSSTYPKKVVPSAFTSDVVLNVNEISYYGKLLGPNVSDVTISGAMHDIVLSQQAVRAIYFEQIKSFLNAF